tara:strand:+ start:312 stop:1058 length:747 start_codon:yes stop_codon:yes gene_type:complete
MDLVSVVIPYHKKKKFIKQVILSVLNQSYQDLEIFIIYDDESKTDLDFIKNIKNLDKRIKVIVNKENLGVGKSRNKAIENANGKFIAFLDADDIWHPLKISKQIEFMIKNNFSITHTSYNIINEENKKVGIRPAKNLKFSDLLKSCDIGLSTVILEKKLLHNLCFSNLKTKEDYVLWLQLTKKGYEFKAFDEFLTDWRLTKNSLSSSAIQKLQDGFRVYNKFMKFNFFLSIYYLVHLSLNYLIKRIND